jgi:hypothetical protein
MATGKLFVTENLFATSSGERTLAACWSPHSAATDFSLRDTLNPIVDLQKKFVIAKCDHQHSE